MEDDKTYSEIRKTVAKSYLNLASDNYSIGKLNRNYFSFTFSVSSQDNSTDLSSVFVKIPKNNLRSNEIAILPIRDEDHQLALDEKESLSLLSERWNSDDLNVRWIKLKGFIPEYNALITERVFADEALNTFRRWDLWRRVGRVDCAHKLRRSMARLGQSMARFHVSEEQEADLYFSSEIPKIRNYCEDITFLSGSFWPNRVLDLISAMRDKKLHGTQVPTLKGIDIRNILIDHDLKLTLLDPGKCKFTFAEADLARFLMTYRILYWGSHSLLWFRCPDSRAEMAFIEAYQSVRLSQVIYCTITYSKKH